MEPHRRDHFKPARQDRFGGRRRRRFDRLIRDDEMRWTRSRRFSSTIGSGGSPAAALFNSSSAGTLAAGLVGSNLSSAASASLPISAPPGTRAQLVSTPSRISLLAGSPPSS